MSVAKNIYMGVARAIAEHFGCDIESIREARYHYGRTGTLQIYTVGDDYFTATKGTAKPPIPHDPNYRWEWDKQDSWVSKTYGWTIYKARNQ